MSNPPLTLPIAHTAAHKGTFGRVLLIGGSRGMAGSIALSSIAALHSGSGLVSTAVPDPILETVASFHPAIMTIALPCSGGAIGDGAWSRIESTAAQQDAIGIGPGMTTGTGGASLVEGILQQRSTPVVCDADALNTIAQQGWLSESRFIRQREDSDLVLTPHPGELARLTGLPATAPEQQIEAAAKIANEKNVTIVVKGGPTHVIGSSNQIYVNQTGNPGMATAGSGDVLTGIITSLLGQGLSGWDAARLGVWLHGVAGDEAARQKSQAGMTSLHLVETLAEVADRIRA